MRFAERRSWLLRDCTIEGARLDCRIRSGVVAELGVKLLPEQADEVIHAHGGALLPGLADHHIHLLAAAAAANSLDLRGANVNIDETLSCCGSGWLRVIGAGGAFRRNDLDRRWPDRPVRVQHRSGALWVLNSLAVDVLAAGLTDVERTTGQLWRADDRLRELLARAGERGVPNIGEFGNDLLRYGVTHLTDATPALDPATIAVLTAAVPQHLLSLAGGGTGARKLLLDECDLPDLTKFAQLIKHIHVGGRPVAIHVITSVTLAVAIAALTAAGTVPGDRLEHVCICDDAAADRLAELGVTVVTQPTIFARHGKRFIEESPPHERDLLWRYNGLLRAGVGVAASSDAPYGDSNPWRTVSAATQRGIESVDARTALESMMTDLRAPAGPVRRVQAGVVADLFLANGPLDVVLAEAVKSSATPVIATFVAGEACYLHPRVELRSHTG